jgi:pimeloyl-ACP methyl ester carboxylesterase
MPFLRAGGHDLEYRWIPARRTDAPTLVFLHSALGSAGLWGDFPDHLAERTGGGALVYSRQGHGASDPLPPEHDARYLFHESRVVLPDVLAARGIAKPVLVGHSDGATIAIIAAAERDPTIRGVVLVAPHVLVEDISVQGIAQSVDAYEHADLRAKLAEHHTHVDGMFSRWVDVWQSSEFRSWNIVDLLPSITCPALVIQGEDDRYGTLEQVALIERHLGGTVESLVLADCGHAPQIDHPDVVLDAMARFIQRL